MESLNNIKKEDNNLRQNHFAPLKFRKFQIDVDDSGAHILISANFLKKYNHTVAVQDGMLHLKIKQGRSAHYSHKDSLPFGIYEKGMDFHIKLPNKQHRVLNSVLFQDGILKIHLTESNKVDDEIAFPKPSLMLNQMTAS